MKMHLLSGGRLRMRKNIFVPDAEKNETIELSVPCALIRHARGNVLFDTGCHPTGAEHAEARWGGLARLMTPIMPANENVVDGLSRLGLSCDDIDLVVCSHLRPDHCGCNSFFNRATFVMHRNEVEAARAPGAQAQGYLASEWEQEAPIDMIDGERDVFGDGRMVLLPLPGHT
ncbi:MAG: N-acyl homoserine lactonase family protein, partial [Xanthobacteraceae bacterium]